MTLKSIFCKAFVGGHWKVGYRDLQNDATDSYKFAEVNLPRGQWVADPFLFEKDGKHYLFCEQYETELNRAGIGYFEFENGVPVNKGMIIRKPYHMSYPCVFTYGDQIYMIPETSANKTIEMYRAVQFPDKWELDTVLLQGARYWDSTVFEKEGKIYLLSYTKTDSGWHLENFALDMERKQITKLCNKDYKSNVARPAGFLFYNNSQLLRPAQDCKEKYGEAMILYCVTALTDEAYDEVPEQIVRVQQYSFPEKVHRIHTINRDSRYEVVDVFQEKFDLFRAWKIFKRSVLRR